jgi:hypothetical protein
MSNGFPSHSCAAAILSHGEVVEGAGRFLVSRQISGRGHKMSEFRTLLSQEPRAL